MEERIYNMNHYENIRIEDFGFGKTQGLTIKVGRKTYKVDIDKNSKNTYFSIYSGKGSKYGKEGNLHSVFVKNTAVITREVVENMAKIEKAQNVLSEFRGILDMTI